MPTFSANDILDKTLIAKKTVAIRRSPDTTAPVVFNVKPGETVGVVYSWVQRGGHLWWMYYDNQGGTYYTIHEPGLYDIQSLQAQGSVSLEDVQEQQAKANSPITYYGDKLFTLATWGVGIWIGIELYKEFDRK